FVLLWVGGAVGAHAVSEADGIGDGDASNCWRGLLVADDNGARGGMGALGKIVGAEIDPAVSDLVVRNSDLRFSAGVTDAVELKAAIAAVHDPSVTPLAARFGNVRNVGGGGGCPP